MEIGICCKCGVNDFVAPFTEGLLCYDCMDAQQAGELLEYAEPQVPHTYPCHRCKAQDEHVIFIGLEQVCDECFLELTAEYQGDPEGFEDWVETKLLDKRIASFH